MPGDDVRLSAAIMTHPARAGHARELAARLPELDPVCVVDETGPDRGNLANALRAWAAVGDDATHHLVLQDDVILCDRFTELVHSAVRSRPDEAVSLFCEWGSRTATLVRAAAWQGLSWARAVDMYTPSQALVMPRAVALDFVASAADPDGPDDLALASHLRRTGVPSVVTVPNLLEHDDRPSLTGNGFQGLRRSACPPPPGIGPLAASEAAGSGLVWLPYVSWMRVYAEWCYCGTIAEPAWIGEPADTKLPKGFAKAELADAFAEALDAADPALRRAVSEVTLFEFWTAYTALGLAVPGAARPGPLAETAFGTALPGAFRRYLSASALEALAPAAGRFAMAAFALGSAAEIDRPHPAWYTEET
ncbi:hypothetical protein [Glycomyces tenuis]|uniref:hypothetical protein n=1 Tax=Glycomyces tenuis TaxID=58116 RepID=UPI0003F62F9B|nr:hypothetical protein [Glycomyces tenuis]